MKRQNNKANYLKLQETGASLLYTTVPPPRALSKKPSRYPHRKIEVMVQPSQRLSLRTLKRIFFSSERPSRVRRAKTPQHQRIKKSFTAVGNTQTAVV